MRELKALLSQRHHDLDPWLIGKIPVHYKRLSIPMERAKKYAVDGASTIFAKFGDKLFFTQALIAGAILSDDFDEYVIISPSQYGKSWLMGDISLAMASEGMPLRIAGGSAQMTDIIMDYTIKATLKSSAEIKRQLLMKKDRLEKLATSTSKTKISFVNGGYVEPISLGEAYSGNIRNNQAVGRGSHFILDEAALISEDTFAEMGRREFASIDGTRMKMIMISNPHQPGVFMDKLTEECPERRLVIWMDALTAIEEERFTEEVVLNSDFARVKSTRRRYLLCVLDNEGEGMFATPKVFKGEVEGDYVQRFMGVDSAYKGKDNIEVCITAVTGGKIYVEKIIEIKKREWIEGKTSKDIVHEVARIAYQYSVAQCCVDVGWGVWLNEGLVNMSINSKGVNFGESPDRERQKKHHYASTNADRKRDEMHLDFQNLVDDELLEVSEEVWDKIKDTLPYITSERKSNGKVKIRPKSEIKGIIGRSPDEFDSVLLSIQAVIRFLGDSEFAIP